MLQKSDFSSENSSFPAKLLIASSAESADILYASGFNAPDEFLYFQIPGHKMVVVSPLEYARACEEAHDGVEVVDRTVFFHDCPEDQPLPVYLSKRYGVTEWAVPAKFPLAEAEILRAGGIHVRCIAKEPFFPEREQKRAFEVDAIRKSERVTEEMMMLLRDMIRASKINSQGYLELSGKVVTAESLRSEIEGEFKKRGYTAERTIIAPGVQSAQPHNIGSGPVRAGEVIVADIFPRSDETGYWGDMTRTFVKGKAPEIVRKAFDAVLRASEEAKKILRAGATGAEVHLRAAQVLEEASFRTGRDKHNMPCGFFHGLGHGVGLEIHEAPRVSPSNPNPLKAGNVVSVEPGLYYSSWGGIRLEDLVVVRENGYEDFNVMEKELEIS